MKRIKIFLLVFSILLTACSSTIPTPQPTSSSLPASSPTAIPSFTPTIIASPPIPATPTALPPTSVRFAVIGDYGSAGDGLAAVAALVNSWEVDFIITTGDNNYPFGEARTIDENIGQYFHAYIYPYYGEYGEGADQNRFFPSLGNHDWYVADAQAYLDYFTLPGNERYYEFRWQFLHFFVLDSDWAEPDGIGKTSVQALWLKGALAESTGDWKIVYFHHAPYSSGYHGPTPHMQWPFKEWGASVVITGHDHHYERLMVNGLPFFVNGLGGGAIYGIYDIFPGSQARFTGKHGAMLVEATKEEINFQFVTVEGVVADEYILKKE